LRILRTLFSDRAHFERAIIALTSCGHLEVMDATGAVVPEWRLRELARGDELWWNDASFRARITDAGAKYLYPAG
jgi:hypothetical protein